MRSLALYSLILAGACATFACSKSPADTPVAREHATECTQGTVDVSVTYPSDAVKGVTDTVHVYVLSPRYDSGTASCADLIGRALDPYSTSLTRAADFVSKDSLDNVTVPNVETGKALVYVEAVDYGGLVEWSGCEQVTVTSGTTNVAITLARAGVYDCGDPNTKEGAPCDDGKLCTVGEACKQGACTGGLQRDCSAFGDKQCNAGSCDETKGCYAQPYANGTPCDDGNLCTLTDKCTNGVCGGTPRQCYLEATQCQDNTPTGSSCDPSSGQCVFTDKPYGTPCNDGLYCTTGDYCDYGTCYGPTTVTCTPSYDQCGYYTCSEALKGACTYTQTTTTCGNSYYYDNCYQDTCDPVDGCFHYLPAGTPCDSSTSGLSCASYSLTGTPHCSGASSYCQYSYAGTSPGGGCY